MCALGAPCRAASSLFVLLLFDLLRDLLLLDLLILVQLQVTYSFLKLVHLLFA